MSLHLASLRLTGSIQGSKSTWWCCWHREQGKVNSSQTLQVICSATKQWLVLHPKASSHWCNSPRLMNRILSNTTPQCTQVHTSRYPSSLPFLLSPRETHTHWSKAPPAPWTPDLVSSYLLLDLAMWYWLCLSPCFHFSPLPGSPFQHLNMLKVLQPKKEWKY
jgi:hypothetical protein